jgi:hypothetical protein
MTTATQTIRVTFHGLDLEVEGSHFPYRAGTGWGDRWGPQPDEPEEFEISSVRALDDYARPVGPDLFDFIDSLAREAIRELERLCLDTLHIQAEAAAEARADALFDGRNDYDL